MEDEGSVRADRGKRCDNSVIGPLKLTCPVGWPQNTLLRRADSIVCERWFVVSDHGEILRVCSLGATGNSDTIVTARTQIAYVTRLGVVAGTAVADTPREGAIIKRTS